MKFIVTDGAMYTELEKKVPNIKFTTKVNTLQPDLVQSVHKEYIENGSQIITTNTFDANIWKYKKFDILAQNVEDGIKNALKMKEKHDVLVAFNIGPSNEFVEPYGLRKTEEAEENFIKLVELARDYDIDYIYLETFIDIRELVIAIKAIQKITDLPIIASMSYQKNGKTLFGTTPKDQAKIAKKYDVDIVGVNCGDGFEGFQEVVEELLKHTKKPVWIKPNAGKPLLKDGQVIYDFKEDKYLQMVQSLVEQGVAYVGGCCGTSPSFIKALSELNES